MPFSAATGATEAARATGQRTRSAATSSRSQVWRELIMGNLRLVWCVAQPHALSLATEKLGRLGVRYPPHCAITKYVLRPRVRQWEEAPTAIAPMSTDPARLGLRLDEDGGGSFRGRTGVRWRPRRASRGCEPDAAPRGDARRYAYEAACRYASGPSRSCAPEADHDRVRASGSGGGDPFQNAGLYPEQSYGGVRSMDHDTRPLQPRQQGLKPRAFVLLLDEEARLQSRLLRREARGPGRVNGREQRCHGRRYSQNVGPIDLHGVSLLGQDSLGREVDELFRFLAEEPDRRGRRFRRLAAPLIPPRQHGSSPLLDRLAGHRQPQRGEPSRDALIEQRLRRSRLAAHLVLAADQTLHGQQPDPHRIEARP